MIDPRFQGNPLGIGSWQTFATPCKIPPVRDPAGEEFEEFARSHSFAWKPEDWESEVRAEVREGRVTKETSSAVNLLRRKVDKGKGKADA